MIHAAIHDNCSAIVHQEPLIVKVILKSRMLNRTDMVGADIEKDTHIKGKAINPFLEISQTLWCSQS